MLTLLLRLYLRARLWLAEHRENELRTEAEGRYVDGLTYRRLAEVGSRISVLRDRLAYAKHYANKGNHNEAKRLRYEASQIETGSEKSA